MLIFGTILASRKSHDINVFWHIEYKKEHVINNGQINNIYRSSKKKRSSVVRRETSLQVSIY